MEPLEIITLIRGLMEIKSMIDDQIDKQAQRAGLSQEEKDKLFMESRAKVLARDPANIPTPK